MRKQSVRLCSRKVCLQKQEAGQIWPTDCGLPTSDFEQQPFICYRFYGMRIWMRTHYTVLLASVGIYSSIYLPAAARPAGAGWSRMPSAALCGGSPSKRLAWACATGGWAGSKRHSRNVQSLVRTRQAPGTVSVTSATLCLVKVSHRVRPTSKPHT